MTRLSPLSETRALIRTVHSETSLQIFQSLYLQHLQARILAFEHVLQVRARKAEKEACKTF